MRGAVSLLLAVVIAQGPDTVATEGEQLPRGVGSASWGTWVGTAGLDPQRAGQDRAVPQPAPHRGVSAPVTKPHWAWPLPGRSVVLRPFDPPERPWGAGHRGVDLAGPVGSPVSAVDGGVVTFSGTVAGVGVVSVLHGSGVRSTYQPVDHRLATGTRVGRGEHLGVLDDGSHCVLVSCLHLGAVVGRRHYLDPLLFLQAWELSLLPLDGVAVGAGPARGGTVGR